MTRIIKNDTLHVVLVGCVKADGWSVVHTTGVNQYDDKIGEREEKCRQLSITRCGECEQRTVDDHVAYLLILLLEVPGL